MPRRTDSAIRRCIATGESRDVTELIRFVVGPDDMVVPDISAKLPGRGIWVTATREALDRVVGKGLFQRAARRPVTVPDDLVGLVERLLVDRCLELLGLARRAGELVTGFEKVSGVVDSGKAAVLIAARDGAEGGRGKIRARAAAIPRVELFDVEELSLALGRQNVVHAALCPGGLAKRLLTEAKRVGGFRHSGSDLFEPATAGDETT